jgi:hypothetical protein
MHARYYSAALGRFLSVDPGGIAVGSPQMWNRYAYALNSPMNNIDPDGRCTFTLTDGSTYTDDNTVCAETTAKAPTVDPVNNGRYRNDLNEWNTLNRDLDRERQQMQKRDQREHDRDQQEQQRVSNCYSNNRFSSLFGGGTTSDVVGALEVGSEISLASDVVATAYKTTQVSLGNQAYASGMNYGFRALGRAVDNRALGRSLTKFGDKATPALAVFATFTGAYNATIYVQCRAGFL